MKSNAHVAKGYTLIEIMTAVMIVGLLAAITISGLQNYRNEAGIAQTKANLENLRTAVEIFYAEEGTWPKNNLSDLTGAGSGNVYIGAIPKDGIKNNNIVVTTLDDSGGWLWDPTAHTLLPNLTGMDPKGTAYNDY